jgi:N-acetylated-alpha-linked acidic dipeptidase
MPGDPLTPGYAALDTNTTRIALNETTNLPKIPSLPISWQDAIPFLKALEGFGDQIPTWAGGIQDIQYYTGPNTELKVNLVNYNDFQVKPIWNVIGKIKGTSEPNRTVIIGNHRDAWGYGAVDPSSGSAVMVKDVSN